MEIFSLTMSSQLLISVPGKLAMGSFEVLRFVVIFESARLTWAQPIKMIQVFLMIDGVESRIPLTPNTPDFKYLLTWMTEVGMSVEQEEALHPLILEIEDYCEGTNTH